MVDWNNSLEPFQGDFFRSEARFPAIIAAVGTGKTRLASLKAVYLSKWYKDNLGLILRKSYRDLADSTIKDFEIYTGLKVSSEGNVKLGDGSVIMFRHLDQFAGVVKNINLGWWYIEQAEEFDSDAEFEFLGDRLRRVLTPCREIQQELIEAQVLSDFVEDFSLLNEDERLRLESEIIRLGYFIRQGITIANANGHNWIWRKFKNKGGKEYIIDKPFVVTNSAGTKTYNFGRFASLTEATMFDNIMHLPADFVAAQRLKAVTAPAHYRRLVLNSHEESDTEDRVIRYQDIYEAIDRKLLDNDIDPVIISCDPAEEGDECVIYVLRGYGIIGQKIMRKKELMETAGWVYSMFKQHHADRIIVDDVGIGAGVRSRLRELLGKDMAGVVLMAFNSGRAALDKVHYPRMKDQIWMFAGQLFRDGYVSIPDDPLLVEDLAAFTYTKTSKGQDIIARKKDIKKKLSRSPDRGDALVMGLWAASRAKRFENLALVGAGQSADEDYDPLTYGLK